MERHLWRFLYRRALLPHSISTRQRSRFDILYRTLTRNREAFRQSAYSQVLGFLSSSVALAIPILPGVTSLLRDAAAPKDKAKPKPGPNLQLPPEWTTAVLEAGQLFSDFPFFVLKESKLKFASILRDFSVVDNISLKGIRLRLSIWECQGLGSSTLVARQKAAIPPGLLRSTPTPGVRVTSPFRMLSKKIG